MSPRPMSRRTFLQFSAMMTAGTIAVACTAAVPGTGSEATDDTAAPAAESRSVTFMSIGGENDQTMFQQALEVAGEQPGLTDRGIVIEFQPFPGGDWNRVMSMFASDTAYDVQRIDDDLVAELALSNKVYQLDCWMELYEMQVDAYFPLFWQTINLGGYQFSMNPLGGANCVYYNAALFEEAGLDLPPSTWAEAWEWDEFLEIAERLVKKDSNGQPLQYALGFPRNVISPIIYGSGSSYLNADQTQCAVVEPGTVDIVQQFIDLTVPGGPEWFVPPGVDRTELFNAGKLAMNWESMGWQNNIAPGIEWDICPWMKTPLYAMTENYDRTFVISKTAPDAEAAFLVLKTLCEQPTIDVFAEYKFGVPYLIASAEGPAFLDGEKPDNRQVWTETFGEIDGQRVDAPTPRGPAGAYKNTFAETNLFESALVGQTTAQEFLESGCQQAQQVLDEMNWRAGEMERRLSEAGALTCEGTKMWPETDWP